MRKSIATPLRGQPGLATASASSIPMPRRSSSIFTPANNTAPRITSRPPFQASQDASNIDRSTTTIDILRAENHGLKYELSNLKDEREREKLRFEATIRELELKIAEEGKRADALESDQQFLFEKHKESTAELNKLKEEWPAEKSALEKKNRSLQHDLSEAREAHDEASSALRSANSALKRQADEMKVKEQTLTSAVRDLQEQLALLNTALQEKLVDLNERNEIVEKLSSENKSLKAKTDDLHLLDTMQRQLSEQLAKSKSLESKLHIMTPELNQLREEHKKFKFMAEEKTLLEARLKLMEDLRRQIAEVELEAATLREERARWTAFFDETDNFKCPEDVLKALSQERTEKIALIDKVGRLEAEIAARTQGMQVDEQEMKKVEQHVQELKDALDKNGKLMARVERQKNLAAKEAAFLRDQLKTYDSEETMYMQGNYDKQKAGRIEELESILEDSKQEIVKLTAELKQAEIVNSGQSNIRKHRIEENDDERIGELLRRNRKLQDGYTALVNKEELARKEIAVLEKRIAALEQVEQAQARVVELRDNPAAKDQIVKKKMLDALQKENNSLIAQLNGRREDIGQVVGVNTLDRLKLEMKEMETLVAEKEKRMKRLKEIWSAKSMEFREAVYSLLGYKLDFLPNNKVRATSMFAASDEESFTFDPELGTMKLSGRADSPFAQECSNLIQFWVQERREIPCFLAALNLELYDKTTKAARF
ncbi:spindle assembly checkpoint component Mad1 [Lipomyces chichibuensis]|uniref:spindle assembly checkpoint component Mad1 n=1 Tax=Lipomyces chichibuensis TaxID=1546026 RepID=UPI003343291B